MISYNITTKVTWDNVDEWIDWQIEEHIPEVMATDLFDDYKMFRLLEEEEDGATFTIQYFTSIKDRYDQYILQFSKILRDKAFKRWGNKFISHRTLMELVD